MSRSDMLQMMMMLRMAKPYALLGGFGTIGNTRVSVAYYSFYDNIQLYDMLFMIFFLME